MVDDGGEYITNRHFEREINILREFAKARLDSTDGTIKAQNEFLSTRFDGLMRADAALSQQMSLLQNKLSDVVGRLDRAEGGTARHSATIAMAVSISAVLMSLVIGGLSIIKVNNPPPQKPQQNVSGT